MTMATAVVCPVQPMLETNGEASSSKDTKYKCKFCGKFYSSSHSLKTHEKWHTGDLKHKCTYCEKKFRNPSEVKRHEMTHTGERPNKCPHCKMKFIQKTSLREHIEKKHQSDSNSPNQSENLICKYCQKVFEDRESLNQHEEAEAKDFEALHESFEQDEFKELENFSFQDYLPQGIADDKGAFSEQILKNDQHTSIVPLFSDTVTILSKRPSNNNDINFEVPPAKLSHMSVNSVSNSCNSRLSENGSVNQIKQESEALGFDKCLSVSSHDQEFTKSAFLKDDIFPFSFPENFIADPVEDDKLKESQLLPKTELQTFASDVKESKELAKIKVEDAKFDAAPIIKEEDKVDELAQFFEELEGQYPHLKSELVESFQIPAFPSTSSTSLLLSNCLKTDVDRSTSNETSRFTGASTPVDTIQASGLTQPSPPSYHPHVLSPVAANAVPSPELQNQNVSREVVNSASIPPVIHIAQLDQSTIQSHRVVSSTSTDGIFPTQTQYFQSTDQVQPLSYQDELNEFCEGILNQIESSSWNELAVANEIQTLPTNEVTETKMQQDQSQIQIQPIVYASRQNSNVSQISPKENTSQISLDSSEKWITDRSSIPNGWRMKIVDTLVGTRTMKKSQFLSPTGQFFDSRKSALDHMIRTMAYSTEDIETMKKGLRNKTKFEWESGREGVPQGWKTRQKLSSDGKVRIFYLSPGGISFPCRLAAYDHMVKDGGYRQEDIDMMKIGAKSKRNRGKDFREGDPSIPPGWKIRINAQNKESFRSPEGVFFHSRQTVLDHIIKEGYPQEYIDIVRSKIPVGRKKRRKKNSSDIKWEENDPTVPENWKMRIVTCSDGHAVTFFLTPEGVTIKGRKAALQHMIKSGLYSSKDLDLMKSHLNVLSRVSDIWIPGDPTLPAGWKIKKYKSKAETNRVHCEYLSPQNHVFRSRKAVIEHMRKAGTYTEEDVRIVESGNVKIKPKSTESSVQKNACWKESESLPMGWKMKEEGEQSGRRCMFLSPEGKIFWTRFQVLEGMAKSGKYSAEDFAKVREALEDFPSSNNNNTNITKVTTISKPCTLLPNSQQNYYSANTQLNPVSPSTSKSQFDEAFSKPLPSRPVQRSPSVLPTQLGNIFQSDSCQVTSKVSLQESQKSEPQSVLHGTAFINYDPSQPQSLMPARVTLAGRPTILQAKQVKMNEN